MTDWTKGNLRGYLILLHIFLGVVTHSSGNHAQALALAAKLKGIPAYVVMPSNSPQCKKDAVKETYGASVIECEPTLPARENITEKVMSETGATFIHPYNNPHIIAGQGTLALEFLEQVQSQFNRKLDCLIVPVGGGGMLSGCCIAAKHLNPNIRIFAAEPLAVDDCARSMEKGERLVAPTAPKSVADGLLTGKSS